MLQSITDYLLVLMDNLGLVGIFIATALESFFAPIPSEIVLFTAGFYANGNGGVPMLLLMCVVAAFGNWAGTLPFYALCRFGAESYLPRFLKKFGPYLLLSPDSLEKAKKYFDRHGPITVLLAKLIPTVRSLVAFPAGLAKMNFALYTFYSLLGSFIWNFILGAVGYWAFDRKDEVLALLEPISWVVIGVIVVAVLVYLLKVIYEIRKLRQIV